MNDRAKALLDNIVNQISSNTISQFMHKSLFGTDVPMVKWSALNRFSCYISGTEDARGYRQWQEVGRYVRKGSSAIHIFAPLMIDMENEEEKKLVGFKPIPVFRVEDTDGDPLSYANQIRSVDPAALPLAELSKELGIEVQVGTTTKSEYGSFSPAAKKIRICTDSEQTFLHELSHAIDHLLGNKEASEVVAELSACFLASLYGLQANIGFTQEYIKSWSKGSHVAWAIGNALDHVKAIYCFIENWELENKKAVKKRSKESSLLA